jgi:hypothetical protein
MASWLLFGASSFLLCSSRARDSSDPLRSTHSRHSAHENGNARAAAPAATRSAGGDSLAAARTTRAVSPPGAPPTHGPPTPPAPSLRLRRNPRVGREDALEVQRIRCGDLDHASAVPLLQARQPRRAAGAAQARINSIASGRAYCSPEKRWTKRPPRMSPRARGAVDAHRSRQGRDALAIDQASEDDAVAVEELRATNSICSSVAGVAVGLRDRRGSVTSGRPGRAGARSYTAALARGVMRRRSRRKNRS